MRIRPWKPLVAVVVVALAAWLVAGCGSEGQTSDGSASEADGQPATSAENEVLVTMDETDEGWAFELNKTEVPAGKVKFVVENDGKFTHEMMVYPQQDMTKMIDMVMAGEHVHGEEALKGYAGGIHEIEPGQKDTVELALTPGTWELGCVLRETVGGETFTHYDKGMHTLLTVTGEGAVTGETGHSEDGHSEGSHLDITIQPIGHWHVFQAKELQFVVQDEATGDSVTGLNLVAQIARAGSERITERSVEEGQIIDAGDGTYTLEYTPSSIGAYGLVARASHDGELFASTPVAFEVARDGEEGIRVDAQGTSYVYQIRHNWDPGHIHASDSESAKLVFEIMRATEEGADIDWDKPWQNTFNHITEAEHPEVFLESEDGAVSEEIHPVYKGKGIYEAERVFSATEVGDGMEYEVRFVFTDPYNGAEVSHAEPFLLHAVAPH